MDEKIFKDIVSMLRKIDELEAIKETLQMGTAEFRTVQDELDAGYHRLKLKNMALNEIASHVLRIHPVDDRDHRTEK